MPHNVGDDLSNFLIVFYGTPFISTSVGAGRAFVLSYGDSVLAFTYKETDGEFFIITCLTVKEMNSLKPQLPPLAFNLHYGETFTRPKIRHWITTAHMMELCKRWKNKIPPPPRLPPHVNKSSGWTAARLKPSAMELG